MRDELPNYCRFEKKKRKIKKKRCVKIIYLPSLLKILFPSGTQS